MADKKVNPKPKVNENPTPMSAKSERNEPAASQPPKRIEPALTAGRKRFFPTEAIPRLHYNDPKANELISQEVRQRLRVSVTVGLSNNDT